MTTSTGPAAWVRVSSRRFGLHVEWRRMADRTVTEYTVDTPDDAAGAAPKLGVFVAACDGKLPADAAAVSSKLTIGRDETADLVVEDAGVSRAHVRLENRGSQLFAKDLDSRNGTSLGGEPLPAKGASIGPGSVLRVSKTLLVVLADVSPYLGERHDPYPRLVGGASLDDARLVIDTLAPTKSPILVLGDTGSGKEVVAGAIHDASGRKGRLVAVNCAAVPADLVDAELFGHARGAFSGAVSSRTGLFRAADGGTLFLDEIGELPAAAQAKLLRTLETAEVRPVGSDEVVRVDVRIVAATNRNVDEMVSDGGFRGDLLHRLAGMRITLPPLAARIEDVPLLASHFAQGSELGISVRALERLMLHGWPGNVRELRNAIASAVEIARRRGRQEIETSDVSAVLGAAHPDSANRPDDLETARVTEALAAVAGNVARAAERLGTSRSVLYETLRRLKIDPKLFRAR